MRVAFQPAQRNTVARGAQRSRGSAVRVACSSNSSGADVNRRSVLSTAGAAALAAGAAPLLGLASAGPASASVGGAYNTALVPVEDLGLLQKQGQLQEFRLRAEKAIKEVVGAEDAPSCMRLVLNDAATYDAATKTGGFDGSIVTPEELNRPENVDLKPTVEKLAKAKAVIDAAGEVDGSGPISWADLLVLAAKVTTQAQWAAIKVQRAAIKSGGDVIAGPAFGASWPVKLGRVDSGVPGPEGRVPKAGAPVAEVQAYFNQLAVKPGQSTGGPFAAKPPFWERPMFVLWTAAAADPAAEEARFVEADPKTWSGIKTAYDRSRRTVTRTDYEVDFIDFFTNLTNLGATFRKDAYLHPEEVPALKF